jgi:hypothetical protein
VHARRCEELLIDATGLEDEDAQDLRRRVGDSRADPDTVQHVSSDPGASVLVTTTRLEQVATIAGDGLVAPGTVDADLEPADHHVGDPRRAIHDIARAHAAQPRFHPATPTSLRASKRGW